MYQSMEDDIVLEIVNELTEKLGDKIELQKIKAVGGGCISQSIKMETNKGAFFVKWNSNGPDDLFVTEAEGLREMAAVENLFLQVPEVLISKKTGKLPGYLVLRYLESGGNSRDDEQLGQGLAILHRKFNDRFGFHHNNYCGSTLQNNQWNCDWVDFFGRQRIWHLIELIQRHRSIPSAEINVYERLLQKLPDILGHDPKPSLIHGDLWSGNYMQTAVGPAIIDPATSYSDREMEFSIMSMFGGFSQRVWDAYQNAFPFFSGWKERIRLYQLYHYLNHFYLFGGGYGSSALSIARSFV